jgi:hypothetical protein
MTEENIINTEPAVDTVSEEVTENTETVMDEQDHKAPEDSGENKNDENAEENVSETENASEIDSQVFAATLSNPMFAVFARGRNTDINTAVRDFLFMLKEGRDLIREEVIMRMTPHAGFAGADGIALTERQRKIARDAGMSYREYYDIIRAIPEKNKR